MSEEIDKLKEQIEERLTKQQESKEFKDIGRVAQTKKEKAAYRLITTSLLSDLEQDPVMAYNMVKKDNVWQPIDVNLEKQSGVSSGAAFLKVKIREALPTRPKDNRKKREAYVHFVEFLQNDLSKCKSVSEIESLTESYQKMSADEVIANFIDPELFKVDDEMRAKIKAKIQSDPEYRKYFRYSYGLTALIVTEIFGAKFSNLLFRKSDAANDNWREAKSFESISETESEILISKIIERKDNSINKYKDLIESYKYRTEEEIKRYMSVDFSLSDYSKKYYKNNPQAFRDFAIKSYEDVIKSKIQYFDKEIAKVKPKPDDWSWFEQPKGKSESVKEKNPAINTKEPLAYIKRTGGFKIEDITPRAIVDEFGFNAVNYGNYVDDAWSKQHTKHFLGAMSDLAEMMNLNIKQMNELGKLSIAFGAKGRPGHLATYFSQTKDINLTKGNGDGSVAHEWGHYFDNVIVEFDQKIATSSFASRGDMPDYDISVLFKEFMDFVRKGNDNVTPKVPMTFYAKKSQSVPTYSRYINNNWEREEIKILGTIEETLAQYSDLAKVDYQDRIYTTQIRVFGYIIDAFGLERYEIPLKLGTSYFYHKSAYNLFVYSGTDERGRDAIVVKPRTKYWTSEVELFARAFETVVLKKLMDQGRESTYLVADIPMDDIVAETYFAPYPAAKELEYIENIIDRILLKVRIKFNIGGFVAPSDIREDEYLDLSSDKKTGKVDSGMVVEKISAKEEEIVFIEKDKTVEVVEKEVEAPKTEQKQENIDAVIDGLEVLLETMQGAERKELEEVIEGLKLLK
jgi:hypothetical protein